MKIPFLHLGHDLASTNLHAFSVSSESRVGNMMNVSWRSRMVTIMRLLQLVTELMLTPASPVSHVFRRYDVTIVANMVEKYSELDCNRELHVI